MENNDKLKRVSTVEDFSHSLVHLRLSTITRIILDNAVFLYMFKPRFTQLKSDWRHYQEF